MRHVEWTAERVLFRNLFDNTPSMAWISEVDGYCIYMSPAWYRQTGFAPGAGEGFGWISAIHPQDLLIVERDTRASFEQGLPYAVSYRLLNATGGHVRVDSRGTVQRDGAGAIVGVFGVSHLIAADGHLAVAGVAGATTEALLQPGTDFSRLSRREREVLMLVVAGQSSASIGTALGISGRTVEVHRAHIMSKLGARNLADLMRMVMARPADLGPPG